MLDGNNERRSVQESYAGSVSSGGGRVGDDHTVPTRGDLVAAAGMNPHNTGMALLRLVSEWNSGATPPQAEASSIKELAQRLAVQRVQAQIKADGEPTKLSERRALITAATVTKADIELAHAEQRRQHARFTDWSVEENKLRFQRMKTLPTIRAALLHWVREREWENPEQIVADTLRHFLAPVCSACEGRKRKVIQSRAIGPECRKCRGTGEADLQHGGRGRALLGYIKQCSGQAAADLRSGAHRLRRPAKEEEDRDNLKKHRRIDELRRADAEARADGEQDTAAVAEAFRQSMNGGKNQVTRRE